MSEAILEEGRRKPQSNSIASILKVDATKAVVTRPQGFARTEILFAMAAVVLLAAVIVPNVEIPAEITNPGIKGSRKTESRQIQTAMNAMMAGNAAAFVEAHDGSNGSFATNNWNLYPIGNRDVAPLASYLDIGTSTYFYCYISDGTITEQYEGPVPCLQP